MCHTSVEWFFKTNFLFPQARTNIHKITYNYIWFSSIFSCISSRPQLIGAPMGPAFKFCWVAARGGDSYRMSMSHVCCPCVPLTFHKSGCSAYTLCSLGAPVSVTCRCLYALLSKVDEERCERALQIFFLGGASCWFSPVVESINSPPLPWITLKKQLVRPRFCFLLPGKQFQLDCWVPMDIAALEQMFHSRVLLEQMQFALVKSRRDRHDHCLLKATDVCVNLGFKLR